MLSLPVRRVGRPVSRYPLGYHEICQILAGRATLTGEDGQTVELAPGSTVVLPDGWRGTWDVHETT